jgi:hypothetical protein
MATFSQDSAVPLLSRVEIILSSRRLYREPQVNSRVLDAVNSQSLRCRLMMP